jgi:LacI family transcriptional regulator
MNIKDVAKMAGVSVATVSHVINKTRYVSDELTARVQKAIEEADYHPNVMAGSLRGKKTRTVGLIVPDNANPLYAELAKAIEERLFQRDITLMLCNTEHQLEQENESIDALRSKMVDGLIIIPATSDADHINRLIASGLPVVVLDRPVKGLEADQILIDHYQGVYAATEHLAVNGVKRIAYLDKKYDLLSTSERLRGFKDALAANGLTFDPSLHVACGVSLEDGRRAMEKLMSGGSWPDGVICFDDTIAMGALRAVHDRGLRVPDDIAVIGFDDMPLCAYTVPRLTTVGYPRVRMAEAACAVLLDRIDGNPPAERVRTVLPVHLVVRETTP